MTELIKRFEIQTIADGDEIVAAANLYITSQKKLGCTFIYCFENEKFYFYLEGYYKYIPEISVEKELLMLFRNKSQAFRDKILRLLKIMGHVPYSQLNMGGIINFKNGLYLLSTHEFVPHTPNILCTVRINYDYDPAAQCSRFERFLQEVLPDDPGGIKSLQQFMGYCLMRDCRHEKALFLTGIGANGKGTFTETMQDVFSRENISAASLDSLANPMSRSLIVDKLINIDTEVSKKAEAFEGPFKAITSGEAIEINPKHIQSYTYVPTCKLIFSVNNMPYIDDQSHGFYRRVIMVEFNQRFDNERIDVHLKSTLKDELPGIFNWCLTGYKQVNKSGFSINKKSVEFVTDMRLQNNPLLQFVQEKLIIDPKACVEKAAVYNLYRAWCNENNVRQYSKKKFGLIFYNEFRNITLKDYQLGYGERPQAWKGFRLRSLNDDVFDSEVSDSTWTVSEQ